MLTIRCWRKMWLIALLSVSIMICSVLATLLAVGELTINVRLKSASTPLPRSQHVISKPVGSSPTLPPAARQNASVSRAGTESNSGASGQHQAGGKEKRQNRGKKRRSERAGGRDRADGRGGVAPVSAGPVSRQMTAGSGQIGVLIVDVRPPGEPVSDNVLHSLQAVRRTAPDLRIYKKDSLVWKKRPTNTSWSHVCARTLHNTTHWRSLTDLMGILKFHIAFDSRCLHARTHTTLTHNL